MDLADHLLARAAAEHGIPPKRLAEDARATLLPYAWPGNVRELGNVLERVVLLEDSPVIIAAMLALSGPPGETGFESSSASLRSLDELRAEERQHLVEALNAARGNISRAAARLGIPRNTLRYRLEKHQLNPRDASSPADAGGKEMGILPPKAIRWEERIVALLGATVAASPEGGSFELASLMPELIEKLTSFGARIEQLTPSELVAVFGIDPMEDASRRAVVAAHAMLQALRRLGGGRHGRFAIHVGSYLIARAGAATGMDAHARRRATDIVSMLLRQAGPDQLIADAAAARFLERHFALEAMSGGLAPRYRVVGRERPGFHVGGRTLSPFVGRARDLEMLNQLLARAEAGEAQILGLVGEAGVGKSRLAHEFRLTLARDRVTFLTGRCVGYGGTIPYLPIIELVRDAFGASETDTLAATADKVSAGLAVLGMAPEEARPYVLHLLGVREGTDTLAVSTPEAVRTRTMDALTHIILAASRRRPLILLVEDMQWIDRASEETLAALAESLLSCPLMLLATYRPGYRPPWLGRSYAGQLVVAPLTRSDSHTVVRSVAPELSPEVAESLVAHGEGLPFFLEELARTVADDGVRRSPLHIPDTIQGVLLARLDRLAEEDRRVLETASVIGKDVSVSVLEAVADRPTDALRASLARLQAREFIYQTSAFPVAEYTFRHALTHEVTYESLGEEGRGRQHARVAQAIEAVTPASRERVPEVLAHHYTRARLTQAAVECWHKAGLRALRRCAHAEALAHLRQGLGLVDTLPEGSDRMRQEFFLQLALGNVVIITGGYAAPEVEQAFARARALCDAVGNASDLCPALFGLYLFHTTRAELATARTLAQQLMTVAEREQQRELFLVAHVALGISLHFHGELSEAREHLERAVALYRPEASAREVDVYGQDPGVGALSFLSWLLALQGHCASAVQVAERALSLARQIAHPFSLAMALQWTALTFLIRRDAARARQHGEEGLALVREHGFPLFDAGALWLTGYGLVADGDTALGLQKMREAALAFYGRGAQVGLIHIALLAEVFVDIGRIDDALLVVRHGLVRSDETGEYVYRAELLRIDGEALLAKDGGREDEAEQRFRQAIELARHQGARVLELRAVTSLARLWSRQGKRASAREALEETLAQQTDRRDGIDARAAESLLASLS